MSLPFLTRRCSACCRHREALPATGASFWLSSSWRVCLSQDFIFVGQEPRLSARCAGHPPGLASGQNVVCDDTRLTTICFGWLDTEGYEPHRRRGNKMATIPMIPVDPVKTLNRSIILTKEGMSGSGGDDFICGHCGSVILEDYNPSTVRGNPIYQCGFCENNNDLPFSANHSRHWSSR
jgi:hypothetical protein